MSDLLRFHLDESVDHHVAYALAALGADVTTSTPTYFVASSDQIQWAFAKRENRVFITRNADFLVIAKTDFEGDLPSRVRGFALEWASLHREELRKNWEASRTGERPTKIEPLQ